MDDKIRHLQANQEVYDTLQGVAEDASTEPSSAPATGASSAAAHHAMFATAPSHSTHRTVHPIPYGPSEQTAHTVPNPTSAEVATVEQNFVKWDTNHDGVLDANEIDTAVNDPSNQGAAAAALAVIDEQQGQPGFTSFGASDLSAIEAENKQNGMSSADSYMQYFEGNLNTFHQNGSLYGSAQGPSVDDIDQGQQGDCYFLAALAAKVEKDPQSVKDMIATNEDGTYTVAFSGGSVTVPPPTDTQAAEGARNGTGGRWVQVVEDAYAHYTAQRGASTNPDPYESIGHGGAMATAMTDLGSPNAENVALKWSGPGGVNSAADLGTTLQTAFSSGQSVLAAAFHATDGLPNSHAYTVESFDASTNTVTLRNPWGFLGDSNPNPSSVGLTDLGNGNFKMSLDDFYNNFDYITKG